MRQWNTQEYEKMNRLLTTFSIQILCLTAVAGASDLPPILLAKQDGIEWWSEPSVAPRDDVFATVIYVRSEDPFGQIRSFDRLRIDNF